MTNVFISYAREDLETARHLASALEGAGWSVWWDPKIKAGETFDSVIERELDTADSVVVLWSRHSTVSEWVQNEALAAAERGVLIPARIDDAKLPLAFRRRQTADLTAWGGDPAHPGYRALVEAVAGFVRAAPAASPRDAATLGGQASSAQSRRWLTVVVAAGLLALGTYIGARFVAPDAATAERKAATLPPPAVERAQPSADGSAPPRREPETDRSTAAQAAQPGIFEFHWPGGDCWAIYRGEIEAKSSCGSGKHTLQAGRYLVKPSYNDAFVPFSVTIESARTTSADAAGGIFEFRWPGKDCWTIYRGDVEAKSSCGGGKHALQAGTYVIKPSGSPVFEPIQVNVKRGQTTALP